MRLPAATSALASRDLTRTGTAAVTLTAAVARCGGPRSRLADLVTTVERVWNELADPVQRLADQLATARQQASGLADAALDEAAGAAEASLAELRGLLNSNPLALVAAPARSADGPGPVDTARLGRLRQQVTAASRAAELARLRADADSPDRRGRGRGRRCPGRLAGRHGRPGRAEVKIVAELPPLPGVGGLADQVAALDGLRAAGRWTRLAAELDTLDQQAADLIARCQAAERVRWPCSTGGTSCAACSRPTGPARPGSAPWRTATWRRGIARPRSCSGRPRATCPRPPPR